MYKLDEVKVRKEKTFECNTEGQGGYHTIAKGPSPIIELYKTPRISPLVLTYYGLCLDFKPPVYHDNKRLIISIAVAVMRPEGLKLLQTGNFSLEQIKAATNNFDPANKIGEGRFGPVYKAEEFLNEIGMISSLQHPNLKQLMLVYEFLKNNCLSRALFGNDESLKLKMEWSIRKKICVGCQRASGIHRDIKASNILLDKDLNAKISDFGLAKLCACIAPEYAMHGLTEKADVYSFSVVDL
ncbi:hypothetical protein HID58_075344 [Brassica napus]|uniref:Protein kinase domain-containing protein n=1 Tax=Brassica napus TaxID=3708 RepID=A0ABQ7YJE4_BRANA|nr:hypothetical protein HID58_075344 [Brassica napus]